MEQNEREAYLKQQHLGNSKQKKKKLAIQCDRQENADSKLTSQIAVQTDFPDDAMEDLREQVRKLTKIVADLTVSSLKCSTV